MCRGLEASYLGIGVRLKIGNSNIRVHSVLDEALDNIR